MAGTLVAVVVLLASLAIPFLKLLGLFFLVVTTALGSGRGRPPRTWIDRTIDLVGPWAMLDVFLLAILVSLVELGELATVIPGPGRDMERGVLPCPPPPCAGAGGGSPGGERCEARSDRDPLRRTAAELAREGSLFWIVRSARAGGLTVLARRRIPIPPAG